MKSKRDLSNLFFLSATISPLFLECLKNHTRPKNDILHRRETATAFQPDLIYWESQPKTPLSRAAKLENFVEEKLLYFFMHLLIEDQLTDWTEFVRIQTLNTSAILH